MKKCTKCGLVKEYEQFVRHKSYKDGYYSQCKECAYKLEKAWRQANKEKKNEIRTRYRQKNRETIRIQDQEMYEADPERHRERMLKSGQKYRNGSKYEETRKIHYETHKDEYQARRKLAYAIQSCKIIRPNICQICGNSNKKIHGHHYDYSKPYDVIWVCCTCHRHIHRKINHRERLNDQTPFGDAKVRTSDESGRGEVEELCPPYNL
jgi:hypothetical protein